MVAAGGPQGLPFVFEFWIVLLRISFDLTVVTWIVMWGSLHVAMLWFERWSRNALVDNFQTNRLRIFQDRFFTNLVMEYSRSIHRAGRQR